MEKNLSLVKLEELVEKYNHDERSIIVQLVTKHCAIYREAHGYEKEAKE